MSAFIKSKSLLAPHPNIFYGEYPAKKQKKSKWIDNLVQRLHRLSFSVSNTQQKSNALMLENVHTHDAEMSFLSEDELDGHIIEIKRDLHCKGLKHEVLYRAFAIIKEVAKRELNMPHYDSQLTGGWIMMQGKIAEMQTGEGKTLTATLPASCAAMSNMPVHVVTVNDYLVERDANLMRPVYARLGLSVGCVIDGMDEAERQQAYRCDITYCTSKQIVFDYLRDRMLLKQFNTELDFKLSSLYRENPIQEKLLLRGLSFAVVDEVDSVFIDEARTPLILSSKSDDKQQEELHREAVWLARQLDNSLYYLADKKSKQVTLTRQGASYLKQLVVDMNGLWKGERRSKALVEQALCALHCYEKDINYYIDDGEIQIIDENTGRSMPDRSWEAGLHQMIEEKEGCEQTGQNQTIARISYQRFFSRYLKLSGMTGTAIEVAAELNSNYGLLTSQVATNKPCTRQNDKIFIYYTHEDKWQAVVEEAIFQQSKNRPVLIGTRTLKDSEYISVLLKNKGYAHQVLNAKNHALEAEIVDSAGQAGCITVATNMAGRGTDIKLDEAAKAAGGLHVICCEKNDSRRVDRQLIGRCARQGDPGSYKVICSIEDDAVVKYFGNVSLFSKFGKKRKATTEAVLESESKRRKQVRPKMISSLLINLSQRLIENHHRKIRQAMMQADEKRESMLAFTGESE